MPTPKVYGVRVCATDSPGPNKGRSTFVEAILPVNHMIFSQTVTPISFKLGFPLVIGRLNIRTMGTNNPRATHLMIEPASRLAPMEWQDDVGDIVVMRADKEPLSVKALTAFSDYVWEILLSDPHGGGEREKFYKPGNLKEYMSNYPRSRDPEVDFY